MKISILQTNPQFKKIDENLAHLSQQISQIQTDLLVLPELCTTGYSFLNREEALKSAQTAHEFNQFLQPLCQKIGGVIIGGFAERYEDYVYNSALFSTPDGNYFTYRKTHLFYKEKFCFAEGNSGFSVYKHPNIDCKIGMMICYDWRFPESARTLALQGADLIVCPSNLITNVWDIGMRARALENALFVAVANRVGTEHRILPDGSPQDLLFTGKSALYAPNGTTLGVAHAENPDILHFEIDPLLARQKHFNEFNDIFQDRRPEFYTL